MNYVNLPARSEVIPTLHVWGGIVLYAGFLLLVTFMPICFIVCGDRSLEQCLQRHMLSHSTLTMYTTSLGALELPGLSVLFKGAPKRNPL
ncbi:hypothetical protein CEXT_299961 [Caerostris extrusa]|uniref:Uncharacterized protein n=1 Tax=Caerostris extrusa TaxID=172846 RepID=A0AAV4X670_CAEEX|nr:hypothetical protein CEXT_299961 [Caerostris extrusa]